VDKNGEYNAHKFGTLGHFLARIFNSLVVILVCFMLAWMGHGRPPLLAISTMQRHQL